jgi:hypothetical protein
VVVVVDLVYLERVGHRAQARLMEDLVVRLEAAEAEHIGKARMGVLTGQVQAVVAEAGGLLEALAEDLMEATTLQARILVQVVLLAMPEEIVLLEPQGRQAFLAALVVEP